jgi:sulfate adenylyltransferase subunit 1
MAGDNAGFAVHRSRVLAGRFIRPKHETMENQIPSAPDAGRGVLRFITCGSVDDGKSTLIGRLLHDTRAILEDQLAAVAKASRKRGFAGTDLSLLTDGLEAEREQGITIDVAYRYFATPRRKFIIADSPGHEQYTRNMVTGASTADAAVILVDATKGLLPQSKRHLLIAQLLGIRSLIVAVNKLDLAGYRRDVFESVQAAFEGFAAPLRLHGLQFIPLSALHGDMVVERGEQLGWYQGPTLLEALERIDSRDLSASLPFRFPVQFVARGESRGYLGRVASGTVRPGSEVIVLPSGRRTRVKGVSAHEAPREAAQTGDSVALQLEDELDVSRGDMIAEARRPPRTASAFEATLCWLAEAPLDPQGRYLLRHTTRTVKARFASINYKVDIHSLQRRPPQDLVGLNDIVHAALVVQQPIFVDPYGENRATGAFILIDEASNRTVAAGMVE